MKEQKKSGHEQSFVPGFLYLLERNDKAEHSFKTGSLVQRKGFFSIAGKESFWDLTSTIEV